MLTPQIPPSSSPVACQVLTSLALVAAPRHHIQTPNSRAHIRNPRGALREQITYLAHFALLLRFSQKFSVLPFRDLETAMRSLLGFSPWCSLLLLLSLVAASRGLEVGDL